MADKIRFITEDAEHYAGMARQTYLEKFTVERMVEGDGRIYREIYKG